MIKSFAYSLAMAVLISAWILSLKVIFAVESASTPVESNSPDTSMLIGSRKGLPSMVPAISLAMDRG